MVSTWNNYTEQKPNDGKRLYWWRIPEKNYAGLTLRPEWVAPFIHHGAHGGTWTAEFAHWNGYGLELPDGLQWREIEDERSDGDTIWPGLKLLACPFCGSAAKLHWHGRYINAPVWHANKFSIKCSRCNVAKIEFGQNLAAMVSTWNRREGDDDA